MRWFSSTLILLLPAFASSQDDATTRILIQIELMKLRDAKPAPVKPPTVKYQHTYADAYSTAVRKGKPLVMGIGCDAPNGDWITFRREVPWHEWNRPAIVISVPKGDTLWQVKTLPHDATWDDVFDALADYHGKQIKEGLKRRAETTQFRPLQNC